MLFTYELARRQAARGVTANCVDPGFVKGTNLGRTLPKAYQAIGILLTPFMVTPAKSAETAVWAASSPELTTTTGAYFKRGKQVTSSGASKRRCVGPPSVGRHRAARRRRLANNLTGMRRVTSAIPHP